MRFENLVWENARVDHFAIGSGAHDGRGFFSMYFDCEIGGQGSVMRWSPDAINELNAVLGIGDLVRAKGCLVRVGRSGRWGPILALKHILEPRAMMVHVEPKSEPPNASEAITALHRWVPR